MPVGNTIHQPQQGWECPKCGVVNAPWMPMCGCTTRTSVAPQTTGIGDWTPPPSVHICESRR